MIDHTGKFCWNCYVGTTAETEAEAREDVCRTFHGANTSTDVFRLVHTEPPGHEEEAEGLNFSTYVFAFWADDSGEDEDEWEYLHDHYTLPELPNYPIEFTDR